MKASNTRLQLLAGEMIAQRLGAIGQGRPAAVLAQHQVGLGEADVLGPHDLVGGALLEHAVLMDAGLVGKGVAADDRPCCAAPAGPVMLATSRLVGTSRWLLMRVSAW